MHVLIFLFALAPQGLSISHCPESWNETIRQGTGEVSATIVCAEHTVLVDDGKKQTLLNRTGTDDEALLARVVQKLQQEAASQPSGSRVPDDKFELWVQPLMTVLMPALSSGSDWYVSVGVTGRVTPQWEVVAGVTFANGGATIFDESSTTGWQMWFSAAPVLFWHLGSGSPRTGFFIGPKLIVEVAHVGALADDVGGPYPPATSLSLEVGIEAGMRFQFGHIALTISIPSIDIGYGWNQTGLVSFFLNDTLGSGGFPQRGVNAFATDLNFNLLRLGASF